MEARLEVGAVVSLLKSVPNERVYRKDCGQYGEGPRDTLARHGAPFLLECTLKQCRVHGAGQKLH